LAKKEDSNLVTTSFKTSPELKNTIEQVARVSKESTSDFVRNAIFLRMKEMGIDLPDDFTTTSKRGATPRKNAIEAASGSFLSVTRFPTHDFYRLISPETQSICVLSTYSVIVAANLIQLRKAINEYDAHLRVLLLNPQSPLAKLRSRGIFEHDGYIAEEIKNTQSALNELAHTILPDKKDRIKVRLYDDIPPCRIHMIDGTAFLGLLPLGIRGVESPHLKITGKDNPAMLQFLKTQFELVWDRAASWTPSTAE
jgi:hypothetical protein